MRRKGFTTVKMLSLLPEPPRLRVQTIKLDEAAQRLTICIQPLRKTAACPACSVRSRRVHSHYQRTVADLPWAEYAAQLHLQVRKFYCRNPRCPRRIFCERLPQVVAPYRRRTERLAKRLFQLGLAVGGAAGARLSQVVSSKVSRNTVLRELRRNSLPDYPTPRVLGVDDWAQCKNQSYGTVLVDMEQRRSVALLPDRTADTLAQWLQTHPGVELLCRDRAGAYADGAQRGAPDAQQVADRFHLLRNLADTLEQVFHQHRAALKTVRVPPAVPPLSPADRSPVAKPLFDAPLVNSVPVASPAAASSPCRAHQQACYEQVRQLSQQGWTFRAIAQHVGLNRKTAARYAQADQFPERTRPKSPLDPYKPYLLTRWNSGCRTGMRLYEEIQRQGFRGCRSTVLGYITQLRKAQGLAPRTRTLHPTPPVTDPKVERLTPRQATWLVLRHPENMTESDASLLGRLRQAHDAFEQAISLALAFAQLLRDRQPQQLKPWLQRAAQSSLVAFRRLAKSFRRDYAAIKAGATFEWSTSPVEGHINRLKLLKRQMFGRAKLDLLAVRMLHAP